MTTDLPSGTAETNVFSLIWNRRLLVVAVALAFAGVGLLVSELRHKEYTAEASVLLSQPAPTAADPSRDEARYVADQVAVMKSLPIAVKASEIASKDSENPISVDPREFQQRTLITASDESNFVSVSFQADRPKAAATGANATVRAYEAATRQDLQAETDQTLRKLDLAIANAEADAAAASGEVAKDAADLVSRLKAERNRVETSAAVAGEGVSAVYEADAGKAGGPSTLAVLAVSLFLGALVGSGVAYWKGTRSQEFFEALDPQSLLGVPLLAEIPNFGRGGPALKLPALVSPATPAAREFRFLAASLVVNAESNGQQRGRANKVRQPAFVAFVSPSEGDGSTTVAANTALAAAQQGHRVQALDADVEAPGLKSLLALVTPRSSDDGGETMGDDGGETMSVDGGETMSVDGGETNGHREDGAGQVEEHVAPPVIRVGDRGKVAIVDVGSAAPTSMHRRTQREFDFVVADGPPMLDGDHVDEIVRMAGAVVIVVRHRSKAEDARQLINRLEMLGVRPLGYVYNRGGATRKHWTPLRSPQRGVGPPEPVERRPVADASVEDLVQRR
jgi:Mrp family chromosome partitioning ATPase/capsular polysaccharide biosynthesis protein